MKRGDENLSGGGLLGRLGLSDWWSSRLDQDERSLILDRVNGPLSAFAQMDRGEVCLPSEKPYNRFTFLAALSGWFVAKDLRSIGRKIALEAERHIPECIDVLALHFSLGDLISFWERASDWTEDDEDRILSLCRRQVSISGRAALMLAKEYRGAPLPTHSGYHRLLLLLDLEMDGAELGILIAGAKQQGWRGEWDRLIDTTRESPSLVIGEVECVCPACKTELARRPTRKKRCQHCGSFICCRTRPRGRQKVLATEGDALRIDAQWNAIRG